MLRLGDFIVGMKTYIDRGRVEALIVLAVMLVPLCLFFGLVVMPIIIFLFKASLGKP